MPKEIFPKEGRVSLIPKTAAKLLNLGFDVLVESMAGVLSGFTDEDYIESGATIVNKYELYDKTDILIKIHPPQFDVKNNCNEVQLYSKIKFLFSYIYPMTNIDLVKKLVMNKQLTVIACDCVPR